MRFSNSMSVTSILRVDVVETLAGVDALAEEWSALERATPEATGFQSFVWCRAWLAHAAVAPRIVCVRENGRLAMLVPLQIERRFGISVARWVGEPMTQYGDALALPDAGRAQWRQLAEAEMSGWEDVDLLALTRLRADGALSFDAGGGEALLAAPFIDLARWRPQRRKSMERRLKRLAARGTLSLSEAATPAARESIARQALALKRGWLRRKGVFSAGLSNPASEPFLAALARDGHLRVNALCVGDEIAAIDLGFVGGGAYRSLLGCFEPRFADGSPGHALTAQIVARSAQEGLAAYDMLLPADSYKRFWATGETAIGAIYRPRNLKGRLAVFVFARLRPLAKRALHGLGGLYGRLATETFSFGAEGASLTVSGREGTAS